MPRLIRMFQADTIPLYNRQDSQFVAKPNDLQIEVDTQQIMQVVPTPENSSADSTQVTTSVSTQRVSPVPDQRETQQSSDKEIIAQTKDTIPESSVIHSFIYPGSTQDSSVFEAKGPVFISENDLPSKILNLDNQVRNKNRTFDSGWVVLTGLFSVLLLLILRVYFSKFVAIIANALVNFQISEKLLREKNIITRRVFLLLNLNFAISFSLFLYLSIRNFNLPLPVTNNFINFLLIFGCLLVILLGRVVLLHLVGFIFDTTQIFKEYIHHTFLLNKNLGLILLPISISLVFVSTQIAQMLLITGVILLGIFAILRIFRGIQIIIKHGVFLFYSILYLCTLEILPLLLGRKIYILLI